VNFFINSSLNSIDRDITGIRIPYPGGFISTQRILLPKEKRYSKSEYSTLKGKTALQIGGFYSQKKYLALNWSIWLQNQTFGIDIGVLFHEKRTLDYFNENKSLRNVFGTLEKNSGANEYRLRII